MQAFGRNQSLMEPMNGTEEMVADSPETTPPRSRAPKMYASCTDVSV